MSSSSNTGSNQTKFANSNLNNVFSKPAAAGAATAGGTAFNKFSGMLVLKVWSVPTAVLPWIVNRLLSGVGSFAMVLRTYRSSLTFSAETNRWSLTRGCRRQIVCSKTCESPIHQEGRYCAKGTTFLSRRVCPFSDGKRPPPPRRSMPEMILQLSSSLRTPPAAG